MTEICDNCTKEYNLLHEVMSNYRAKCKQLEKDNRKMGYFISHFIEQGFSCAYKAKKKELKDFIYNMINHAESLVMEIEKEDKK